MILEGWILVGTLLFVLVLLVWALIDLSMEDALRDELDRVQAENDWQWPKHY